MSTVYNAVCVSTVHCVTLCITLCCTGHRALAHVRECQPDVSGRAVRIQWLDQEMLTPRDMQYFLYSSWKLIFTYYVILFIFFAIILIINIIPGSPFNFQGLRAEITFMGSSCAQSASQNLKIIFCSANLQYISTRPSISNVLIFWAHVQTAYVSFSRRCA